MSSVSKPRVRHNRHKQGLNLTLEKLSADFRYYTFLGMKKADGMNRRLMLKGYEVNGYENNGMVYPLADWTQKDILAYMRQHNLPEPIRYSLKASSGVGFNLDCMLWMEKNYPQDLQRIYKVFPMAERVLWEYHNQQK